MKTPLLVGLALFVIVLVPNGYLYAAEPLTLEATIAIGLENNYNILIARNNASIAANNTGKGRAEFLPTVLATANAGKSSSDVETNSRFSYGNTDTDSWRAQIALDWTIFDGFKMFAEKNRFDALAKLGQAQARSLIENSVVGISRAYFGLVISEQLYDVALATQEISQVRLDKEKLRRELGGASSTDLLNATVSFNADQAGLLEGELAVVVARQELNLLLGRNADTPLEVVKELLVPELPANRSTLLKLMLERNADLLLIGQQRRVSESILASSKSKFLPRVSLAGSYSHSDGRTALAGDTVIININKEKAIGLNLTWNLFNGGRDLIDRQNARVDLNNQQLALRQVRQRLEGLLSEQLATYQRRNLLVALETENVKAASRNLDLIRERYEVGAATSLEFRDAQTQLSRIQVGLISARHQTRIAHLEIERLSGSLSID